VLPARITGIVAGEVHDGISPQVPEACGADAGGDGILAAGILPSDHKGPEDNIVRDVEKVVAVSDLVAELQSHPGIPCFLVDSCWQVASIIGAAFILAALAYNRGI
jgi:hypothetical protein